MRQGPARPPVCFPTVCGESGRDASPLSEAISTPEINSMMHDRSDWGSAHGGPTEQTAGAKAHAHFQRFTARLKSCPSQDPRESDSSRDLRKPPRQPLFWGALAFALGLWIGVRAWRPPLWWVIAVVGVRFCGVMVSSEARLAGQGARVGRVVSSGRFSDSGSRSTVGRSSHSHPGGWP